MPKKIYEEIREQLVSIKDAGMFKTERVLNSAQGNEITLTDGRIVTNFCANNYLGLSNNPEVIKAAQKTMDDWGFGLSSVRFICGTQDIHKQLEDKVSQFLGKEDTILFSSCFDANGGVFEPLLHPESAVISDALNHASIIDGVRLCKAKRFRFKHSDMEDLEEMLKASHDCKYRLIVTDGVFSMDGDIAKLREICDLADKYDALVMVDDSHATGYVGKTGRGTPEYWGVTDRVDIITTTFGKALGGAAGGCISGQKDVISLLRQHARPYLFSNTIPPAIVGGVLKVLDMLTNSSKLVRKVKSSADIFRQGMIDAGFDIVEGNTAIVSVMFYEEPLAIKVADRLLELGIYVIGFCFPVVPRGKARIRVQISASHTEKEVQECIAAFEKVGKEMNILK
ncbi:MAG: glycine C-acetyltransferase [Candidatus Zophobacter franzmannii]|nr:glycine C-acetyltransferase [Candidatus Zophobacter franzmannii]